ncbi:MAG: NUDIX domain-containing protein [Candidatus Dojkabacteria bacterium]
MEKFQLDVRALVLKGDEVLFLMSNKDSSWDLPGGLLNQSELPDAAITREIRAQTALETENLALVSNTIYNRDNTPTLALFYLVDYKERNVDISDQFSKFAWIKLSDVKDQTLPDWIKKHLVELLKKYQTPQ